MYHDIEISRPKNHDMEIPKLKSHGIEFLRNSNLMFPDKNKWDQQYPKSHV